MRINKKNIETEKDIEEATPSEEQAESVEDAGVVVAQEDTEHKEPAPPEKEPEETVAEEEDDTPIAIIGTTITEKKLAELKKQYGKRGIFKTRFINDLFVWHKLNRSTFSKIISDTRGIEDKEEQNIKCEQEFVRASVIWPEITQEFLETEDVTVAGLSEEILYNSGFVPPQTERV